MNKAGLSGIVSAVIMIGLVLAAVAIVWSVVNSMITEETEGASACFGNFNKVTINGYYTCYNIVDKTVEVSIDVADADVDTIIATVYSNKARTTFEIPGTNANVKNYGDVSYGSNLTRIPANSGKTYVIDGMDSAPDMIQISPVINGKQCEIADKMTSIKTCSI